MKLIWIMLLVGAASPTSLGGVAFFLSLVDGAAVSFFFFFERYFHVDEIDLKLKKNFK